MYKNPVFIFLLTLISCSPGQKKEAGASNGSTDYPAAPLVIESAEEGWGADMKLSIVHETATDTSITYTVNALYEDKNTGFILTVPAKGSGKLRFKTNGEASNNFLRLLKKLYKQNDSTLNAFADSVTVTGIDLREMIKGLGAKNTGDYHTAAQYKVFYQGEKESDYAEMYLNINTSEHWVEWKEKDEEYRPVITGMLTKK